MPDPNPLELKELRQVEGLSFLETPGPGDSEGGEIYAPDPAPLGKGVAKP